MSSVVKLSIAQLSKINLSGGFLGKRLGNLDKKALLDLAFPLAKDVLSKLTTKPTSSILIKFERKKVEMEPLEREKGFTFKLRYK